MIGPRVRIEIGLEGRIEVTVHDAGPDTARLADWVLQDADRWTLLLLADACAKALERG